MKNIVRKQLNLFARVTSHTPFFVFEVFPCVPFFAFLNCFRWVRYLVITHIPLHYIDNFRADFAVRYSLQLALSVNWGDGLKFQGSDHSLLCYSANTYFTTSHVLAYLNPLNNEFNHHENLIIHRLPISSNSEIVVIVVTR